MKIISYLNPRLDLTPEENHQMRQLQKNYSDKLKTIKHYKNNIPKHYTLSSDLLFKNNHNFYSIDCLIINNKSILLYDFITYEGNVYEEKNDRLVAAKDIDKSFQYLYESCSVLNKFIQQKTSKKYNFRLFSIFINQGFFITHGSFNEPSTFMVPLEIKGNIDAIKKFENINTTSEEKEQEQLVAWIHEQNIAQQPYDIPKYTFKLLKKGVFCPKCLHKMTKHNQQELICQKCQSVESIKTMVLKNTKQLKVLFPSMKITINKIYEWCDQLISRQAIIKILKKDVLFIHQNRYSFFISNSNY